MYTRLARYMIPRGACCPSHNPDTMTYFQAPSEGIKDDWVSALKLMVAYTKLGSLSSHAERLTLKDALVSRRFVRQVDPNPAL